MPSTHEHNVGHDTTDTRFSAVQNAVRSFLMGMTTRPVWARELGLITQMMQTLPIATDLLDVAERRIENTRKYLESAEFGAAQYEMKLLLGMLTTRWSAEPNRRRR